MIPKIIHYAWFGSPVPENVEKRVKEWQIARNNLDEFSDVD